MISLKLLQRKVLTLVSLSWEEKILLLQAFILLPLVAFSLQVWGLQQTQIVLTQLCQSVIFNSSERQINQAKKITRIVEMAARYSLLWSNCLKKSLVLWFLLRRQGILSQLRIGVQRDNGEFKAHAWIEYSGMVLNDSPYVHQEFAVFANPIDTKI